MCVSAWSTVGCFGVGAVCVGGTAPSLSSSTLFITQKGTFAPAELNFLQWLQMFEELSVISFCSSIPLFWNFLPSVLLGVEVCGCNQTDEGMRVVVQRIPSRAVRRAKGPHHLSPLPSPLCCLQIKINNLNLDYVLLKGWIPLFLLAIRAACACQPRVWAPSAVRLALTPPGLMTSSHFVCCCLFCFVFSPSSQTDI